MEGLVEDVFKKHDLYDCFDKAFVSYKYKDVKPNKSYFDLIINSFDTKFDKVILAKIYADTFSYCPNIKEIDYSDDTRIDNDAFYCSPNIKDIKTKIPYNY